MDARDKLIIALDFSHFEQARAFVEELGDHIKIYKVGSQLFTACGPVIVRHLLASGKDVFLDLKFHDIPNTVAGAVRSAVSLGQLPYQAGEPDKGSAQGILRMLTIHTQGGPEMMKWAVEAAHCECREKSLIRPFILGITVLTSEIKTSNITAIVSERAALAKEAGLDGVVASPSEAAQLRDNFGSDFVIVTPGIRPAGSDAVDQKRISTPADAVNNGSHFLVVGRPVTRAKDPIKAVTRIKEEVLLAMNSIN